MTHPIQKVLKRIGVPDQPAAVAVGNTWQAGSGEPLTVVSPIDGSILVSLQQATTSDVDLAMETSKKAFLQWRQVPAPRRGEFVRLLGEALRKHKADLAAIVSWEAGKITQEALGEVQEMIDICDFAVGLSRQLYGKTIASERPGHRLMEQWQPLGPVGVISAFNFPVLSAAIPSSGNPLKKPRFAPSPVSRSSIRLPMTFPKHLMASPVC